MATSQALSQNYSPDKLRELIVYISHKSLGDPRFGKVKLNKILFFADFAAFRRSGQSITGAVYQHLPQGPCPQQLLPVLGGMGNDVIEMTEPVGSYVQKRLVPLRASDLDAFSGQEISIVDAVLDELRPLTNRQVSDLSHETVAWRATHDGQEIPYGTALLSSDEPTDEDLAWLKEVVNSAAVGSSA